MASAESSMRMKAVTYNHQRGPCHDRAAMNNKQPPNKGLERTRRVGVPAPRAVVGVSPCRSTQCWAGIGEP